VVNESIPTLLKPELTASWEKGLGMIANGEIQSHEYIAKLEAYIRKNTQRVLESNHSSLLNVNAFSGRTNTNKNNRTEVERRKVKQGLGKCIACETGEIFENSKAFYCSNWKQKCKFTIWKNSLDLYKQELDIEMVKELLEKGRIDKVNIVLPQTKEKCTASLEFKENKTGALELKNVSRIAE